MSFSKARKTLSRSHTKFMIARHKMEEDLEALVAEANKTLKPLWKKFFGDNVFPKLDRMAFSGGILKGDWKCDDVLLMPRSSKTLGPKELRRFEKEASEALGIDVGVHRWRAVPFPSAGAA